MRPINEQTGARRRSGFTIVEIIVAFIIIGILASVLTPTLMHRAEEAKITATQQDLEHLADAQERAAIDTNYMFRMNVLNDVPGPGDGIANNMPDNRIGSIRDNGVDTNNIYDSPRKIFILLSTGDYATDYSALFDRMTENETRFGWRGPYINWRRDANRNDWPDDPYGNDYILFTRKGAIMPPVSPYSADSTLSADQSAMFQAMLRFTVGSATGGGTVEKSFSTLVFDRPTLLSLGPNGLPGDGTDSADNRFGTGDDIIRQFGGQ